MKSFRGRDELLHVRVLDDGVAASGWSRTLSGTEDGAVADR